MALHTHSSLYDLAATLHFISNYVSECSHLSLTLLLPWLCLSFVSLVNLPTASGFVSIILLNVTLALGQNTRLPLTEYSSWCYTLGPLGCMDEWSAAPWDRVTSGKGRLQICPLVTLA